MSQTHPQTTRFRATDRIDVTEHARERWRERAWDGRPPGYPADVAWRRARDRPVPWGVHNATYVRYDSQTDCLLVAINHHTGSEARLVLLTVKRAWMELDRPAVRRVVGDALDELGDAIADELGEPAPEVPS